jgi:thioredoxin 1
LESSLSGFFILVRGLSLKTSTRKQPNEKKIQTILNEANFEKEVLENPDPVLVEFGANWSGASHMMAPILEQLREEFDGQIKIARLDIDTSGRVATKYGIQDIPTLTFFKNGQVVDQISGLVPRQVIAAKLRALM